MSDIIKTAASCPVACHLHGELVEALEDILREAIILSEEYLDAFRNWPDSATIQGWDKARWKRALSASKRAQAVLAKARRA